MIPLTNEEAQRLHDELVPVPQWQAPQEIALSRELVVVDWVIPSNIPEGVGLIAGYAGSGKSVAVTPLACTAAGFYEQESDVVAKVHRQVVFFSEDDAQLNRSIYGIRKKLEQDGQKIAFEQFAKKVHIFPSQRITHDEMREKVLWAVKQFSIDHPKLGLVAPLIVFDTASANFDLDDENSSAQVGKAMACLKEIHLVTKAPIWILAHLSKAAKGLTIDELINTSARGSGAWEADCSWTAVIGRESESSRKTILKIDKERTGDLRGHEIHFDVEFCEEYLTDSLGECVIQKYPTVSLRQGDKKARVQMAQDRILQDCINEVARLLETRKYLYKKEILDLIKIKADKKQSLFTELVYQKRLKEIAVPPEEVTHHTKKFGYVLPTIGEKLSDAFSGISGNELLKNTPKTGVFLNG
jgi:hypothetical protein